MVMTAPTWAAFERATDVLVGRRGERAHLRRLAREYGDAREAEGRQKAALERHVDDQLRGAA